MNLFFSGGATTNASMTTETDPRIMAVSDNHFRLFSCHENYLYNAQKAMRAIIPSGFGKRIELMLDSGAFTAWSKGAEVTIEHLLPIYADFIKAYEHEVKAIWLINLDKIPASKGRTATPEELLEAMKISERNFATLVKEFGPRVLPVYHQNEPQSYLLELASASNYICVSPRNDLPEPSRRKWSGEVHRLIPDTKTHGLAATGARMMAEVPWHSVDSASWISIAVYGGIILEDHLKLLTLQISSQSGSSKMMDDHYDNLSPIMQQEVRKRIEAAGFEVEKIRENHIERQLFNRVAMKKYSLRYKTDKHAQHIEEQGLFDL